MKTYIKPDFSLQMFDVADVITVSSEPEDTLTEATVMEGKASWNSTWDPYMTE